MKTPIASATRRSVARSPSMRLNMGPGNAVGVNSDFTDIVRGRLTFPKHNQFDRRVTPASMRA
jgi:hypothetical protein